MSAPEGSTVTFRRIPAEVRPRALQLFARRLQDDIAKGRPFDCLLTGDAELRGLNGRFRGKDEATDVLSFPTGGRGRLGDIAISLGRARLQAREFGHSTETEVRVLMLHGLLHLLGMDHEADAGRMARAEKRWRTRLGLPGGLIERVRA
jgi:probable rRNA maturation factor